MYKSRPALFHGRHFQDHVIVLCVRWNLRYCLTLRAVEELMLERGLNVDHSTIGHWVLRYSPELKRRVRRETRRPNRSWREDETYVRVAGVWTYMYRAVDSAGETIDFMLSPKRAVVAAKHFQQTLIGYTAETAEFVLSASGVVLLIEMPIVGQLTSRIPAKYIIAFGWLALAGVCTIPPSGSIC
jgi:transposase-like protein